MTVDSIAKAFVAARKTGRALADYPGTLPEALTTAYAIQDAAITQWGDAIIGWKIGRLAPEFQGVHKTERLAGPIFSKSLRQFGQDPVVVKVFDEGFAAVEAEYVFRMGKDFDPGQSPPDEDTVIDHLDTVFCGVEMAGSPLKTINALGPCITASDFGNNNGLILGPALMTFGSDSTKAILDEAIPALKAKTTIDSLMVGTGGLINMPGGPLAAISWLAQHLSERGMPLKKGQYISSGAMTGIHEIKAGQMATVSFCDLTQHWHDLTLETQAF